MTEIAVKHGGTVDKYIGDAIMVFFGDPHSLGSQEDALACVRMAIEMKEKMYVFVSSVELAAILLQESI